MVRPDKSRARRKDKRERARRGRGGGDKVDPRAFRAGLARDLIWRCRRRSVTERGQINGAINPIIFNIFIFNTFKIC